MVWTGRDCDRKTIVPAGGTFLRVEIIIFDEKVKSVDSVLTEWYIPIFLFRVSVHSLGAKYANVMVYKDLNSEELNL